MSADLAALPHAFRDEEDLQESYHARGWTDGLLIVAPTPERVEAFLAAANLAPDVLLSEVPTREVRVTAEHAAINAVMAGCRIPPILGILTTRPPTEAYAPFPGNFNPPMPSSFSWWHLLFRRLDTSCPRGGKLS